MLAMELAEYTARVERASSEPFGKRLPGAVYVLREQEVKLGEPLDALLER